MSSHRQQMPLAGKPTMGVIILLCWFVVCRLTLGLIMLGLKGFGFLIALVYSFFSTLSALKEFVCRCAWPYIPCLAKRPEDKLHDVITRVMLQVRPAPPLSFFVVLHSPVGPIHSRPAYCELCLYGMRDCA